MLSLFFFISSALDTHSVNVPDAPIINLNISQSSTPSDTNTTKEDLYVVSEDGFLQGPGFQKNVLDNSVRVNVQPQHKSFSYSVNGQVKHLDTSGHIFRQGKHFTIVQNANTGKIIRMWGKGLHLAPLDYTKHPGVFVNLKKNLQSVPLIRDTVRPHAHHSIADAGLKGSNRQSGGSCSAGTRHYVELAVAYDNTFCAMFSNSDSLAAATIQSVINDASTIYERDTCLSLVLVHIEGHCNDSNDPYVGLPVAGSSSPSQSILFAFQNIWQSTRTSVPRDVAYLFSGFEDGTQVAGVAFVGSTCSSSSAYGWIEGPDVGVFIHELGHNLNANHAASGVMRAVLDRTVPVEFSTESINQITNFVDSENGRRCLGTSLSEECDSSCSGSCLNGRCVTPYTANAPAGIVPCAVVGGSSKCTQTKTYGTLTVCSVTDCEEGFNFIVPKDLTQKNLFCCLDPTSEITAQVIPADTPLFTLQLSTPDGMKTIPKYFRDCNVREPATLMETTLVPSCTLPTTPEISGSPFPAAMSVSPMATPSMMMATITPSPSLASSMSMSPNPSPSSKPMESQTAEQPESSPPPSEGGKNTCGASLPRDVTFRCARTRFPGLEVMGLSEKIESLIIQRSGTFEVTLKAPKDYKVRSASVKVTFDGTLSEDDVVVKAPIEATSEVTGKRFYVTTVDAFAIEKGTGASTCCEEKIYVYMQAEVCKGKDRNACYKSSFVKMMATVKCKKPCSVEKRVLIPFSSSVMCPRCIRK